MANGISLTKANLDSLHRAFDHYFPEGYVYVSDKPFSSGDFNWNNRKDFINFIARLTKVSITSDKDLANIKKAQQALEKLASDGAKEQDSNLPGEELRQQQEIERQKREGSAKKSATDAKKIVDDAIKRKQALHEESKGKKLYRKISEPDHPNLDNTRASAFVNMRDQAMANPKEFTNELANEIQSRVLPTLPEGNKAEAEILAKQAALGVTQNLRGDSPAATVATLYGISTQKNLLEQMYPELVSDIVESADVSAGIEILRYQESYRVLSAAFGDEFADTYFGPKDLSSLNVDISSTPRPGFEEYPLSEVTGRHLEFLQRQDDLFGHISDFGTDNLKSKFLNQVGGWIETQIPKSALLTKAFESQAVRAAFDIYVVGQPLVPTSLFGRIAIESGHGPALAWIGRTTGIDFGITSAGTVTGGYVGVNLAASAASYAATTQAVTLSGGIMASEAFAGGAGVAMSTAAGATAGTATGLAIGQLVIPLPVVGAALGAIAGAVIPKAIKWAKDKLHKSKDFIIAGAGVGFGVVIGAATGIGALSGGIVGGFGGFGLSRVMSGGMSGLTSGFSRGATAMTSAAGFVWATFMAGVGGPLLAIAIGFPVLVVFILIIINSGAFVVPFSSFSESQGYDNPYMSVTKVASPDKIDNGAKTVTYTITVTALKEPLTDISLTSSSCRVTKKNKANVRCPVEDIPDIPAGTTIIPSNPYTFTFTSDFNMTHADSIVFDSVEISANTSGGIGITTSGSETVCVGDCPISCVKVADNADVWPPNPRSNAESAALSLEGGYPSFMSQVCGGGEEVNLCYKPGAVSAGGWHVHNAYGDGCDVYFKGSVLNNEQNALFMLTHELTHHIQKISGVISVYEQSGANRELPICSYPNPVDGKTSTEGMAEANGLYVSIPSWAGCVGNFRNKYPLNYKFAESFMK